MANLNKPEREEGALKMYMQDDENTMLYNPLEMHGNRFWGQWSKVLNISHMLNTEIQEKYFNDYQAHWKA